MRNNIAISGRPTARMGWVERRRARRRLRQAEERAVARFVQSHPRWAESLLDAHFVARHLRPLLERAPDAPLSISPEAVAQIWFAQVAAPQAGSNPDYVAAVSAAVAELLRSIDQELQGAPASALDPASAARLFAEALRDGSNRELDWLWLATRMPGRGERRYCLERALTINPQSELARAELSRLG